MSTVRTTYEFWTFTRRLPSSFEDDCDQVAVHAMKVKIPTTPSPLTCMFLVLLSLPTVCVGQVSIIVLLILGSFCGKL